MSQKVAFEIMSRTLEWKGRHEPGKAVEHCGEDEHSHSKQVVADRHANVKPAATVLDKKKEMQSCEVWHDDD